MTESDNCRNTRQILPIETKLSLDRLLSGVQCRRRSRCVGSVMVDVSQNCRLASVPLWKETFMASGKVKWFDNKRGFGFIAQSSGKDVFVHHSAIQGHGYKTLSQGEWVTFDLVDSGKGPKAAKVERLRPNAGGTGATASSVADWRPPKPQRPRSNNSKGPARRYAPNRSSGFPSTNRPYRPSV